jgi:hypothetical protein
MSGESFDVNFPDVGGHAERRTRFENEGGPRCSTVIIDVAIGLVLSFLAVSLAASAATEAISSAMKW